MDALTLLLCRNSVTKLREPAPHGLKLDTIIQAALRAPDHGRLRPWRYLIIEGCARNSLGNLFAKAAKVENPDIKQEELEKLKKQPLRAPLLLTVIANIEDHERIPRQEKILSAACSAYAILLAAQAQGFAGIWRTGGFAYDETVMRGLGLSTQEQIIAFIYLGTIDGNYKAIPDLKTEDFCQHWQGQ